MHYLFNKVRPKINQVKAIKNNLLVVALQIKKLVVSPFLTSFFTSL